MPPVPWRGCRRVGVSVFRPFDMQHSNVSLQTRSGRLQRLVGLCGLIASLVAGWLWDQAGHATVFLFGAAFAVVGSIALLALVPANPKHDAAVGR
jgi:MFS family permease